ncbi:hypothetical protein ACIBBE_29050 [Streptomyces sp. NPDC051644]|uniref:hypothetical protein n=1 Tax=Streptomyces sp. NPDC051644 TaxID=3365666 RepID=UPI0037A128A2
MGSDEAGDGVDARGVRGLQVGAGNVQFNVFSPAHPVARSAYLHQVRAIAPEALAGREDELAVLADFCTRQDAGDYLCWRARAWAGKTALMSWFVLNPPPDTRIVSFFVTARLAAQNDREAFLDVAIEQLATLLGEPVPPYLTAATRASHLWQMLDAAAAACERQGRRLVLVVDGLDEDSGAAAHSIAALLPPRPPAGMRIVTAGRHDPPIPADVPGGHPLHDPAAVRILEPSPHAQVVRHDAEQELKRLLRGTEAEQDLLGLVTAAGGGLAGEDLAELTGRQVWEIEESLHTVAGRTFARRPSSGLPGPVAAREVYVLGHEELQQTAAHFLSGARLETYRQRLHGWAERYRGKGWPARTPEYLLRGYFRMLYADGDLPRMTECALDGARHDRMLDVSGGDAAALAEIATAQDAILERDSPDLRSMTLLAVHRDDLALRNTHIPTGLPAVWALLGHPLRAEALARSIPGSHGRVRALGALSEALAEWAARDPARPMADEARSHAAELAHEAEAVARTITHAYEHALALLHAAGAMARVAETDHAASLVEDAVEVAWTLLDAELLASALGCAAEAMARSGDTSGAVDLAREAEDAARSITDPWAQALALSYLAVAAARAVDTILALDLADEAESAARTITDPETQAAALSYAAAGMARAGDADRALAVARSITDPHERARALVEVAAGMARAGAVERALAVARSITDPHERARALVEVAGAMARAGDMGRAESLAREAETMVRSGTRWPRESHVGVLAEAMARAGDVDRAEAVAGIITDPYERAEALVQVAGAMAREGAVDRALAVAGSLTDPYERSQAQVLVKVAGVTVRTGDVDRAEDLGCAAETAAWAIGFLGTGALQLKALLEAGEVDPAEDLVDAAETEARSSRSRYGLVLDLAALARGVAWAGDVERAVRLVQEAEDLAWTFDDPYEHARSLWEVAGAMVFAGETDLAEDLFHEAEAAARTIAELDRRASALAEMVEVMALAGVVDRAEAVARTIDFFPVRQAEALVSVAGRVGADRAGPLIAQALRLDAWHTAAPALAVHRPDVLTLLADGLLRGRSGALAR